MDAKLQAGDVVDVHGYVMLAKIDAGAWRIVNVESVNGQAVYSFARLRAKRTRWRHFAKSVDPWLRPTDSPDLNKIVRRDNQPETN